MDAVHFPTPVTAGQLMGFPKDFPWTPEPLRCVCPFCFKGAFVKTPEGQHEIRFKTHADGSSEPTAAAKQIGNAVPLELGAFVGRLILRQFAARTQPQRASPAASHTVGQASQQGRSAAGGPW